MKIGEPPPDPFAGMSPAQRKRAQETAILEMAYDLSKFATVEPGERPDFTLSRRQDRQPFGVEVTQIFPTESHARLNLVHGYHQRLWSGGRHLHKRDAKVLHSVKIEIKDKDGHVKGTGIPAIITETPGLDAFRASLRDAIRGKSAKGYNVDDLRHLDLVILDWFDLPFDANAYFTDRFFDDDVRAALRACPFREVFLLLVGTVKDDEDATNRTEHHRRRLVPLQQLLAMERVYVTGKMIDEECRDQLRDVAHLNALVIDHVSRVQGYGMPVYFGGRPCLRYQSTLIEIDKEGMRVHDLQDSPIGDLTIAEMAERAVPEVQRRITERSRAHVFGCGYSEPANRPSNWPAG